MRLQKEVGGFDFILADLGVSSMQIDNPKRGFSFKVDGPLDLRLNQEKGISAAERLDNISEEELAGMLYENSDEPYCEELAKAITTESARAIALIQQQSLEMSSRRLWISFRIIKKRRTLSKRLAREHSRHFA